jgi:hypothetical protein
MGKNFTLLFTSLVLFSSCGYFNKIRSLKNIAVRDISVFYDSTVLRIPGNSFKIGLRVISEKNDTLYTRGFMDGTLRWNNFNIRTFNCKYTNGSIYIPDVKWALKGSVGIDIEIKTDTKKRIYYTLNKNHLTSFKIIPDGNYLKAPGSSVKLAIAKTYNNSIFEIVRNRKEVNNFFQNCFLYINGCEYKNGYLKINDDIYQIYNHRTGFIAISDQNAFLGDTFEFNLDYIKKYNYYSEAKNGVYGFSAYDGSNGYSGNIGENGGNGSEGGHGGNGSDGYRGHDLTVNFDEFYDTIINTDLCIAEVIDEVEHTTKSYLINPKGGSIIITSRGGSGGNGGHGGNGGKGGNGGAGVVFTKTITKTITVTDSTGSHKKNVEEIVKIQKSGGSGGNGGNGGDGGDAGYGGDGGDIYIYYTDSSAKYLDCINAKSIGGSGGLAGFGGSSGLGGSGGSGNPSGSNGRSGSSGTSGTLGFSGNSGKVYFYKMEEKANNNKVDIFEDILKPPYIFEGIIKHPNSQHSK